MSDNSASDPWPRLLGGELCLDFANTVDSRVSDTAGDCLHSYANLVGWLGYAGGLPEAAAHSLLRQAARQPAAAQAVFTDAIALREAIYRVLVALARGGAPPPADMATLGAAYTTALAYARLAPTPGGYAWEWAAPAALEQALWPVARSAVGLLTSPEVVRVKECANVASCGWLFLDRSKNGSRRWCSMDDCGSRDKMRRQYARRRAAHANG